MTNQASSPDAGLQALWPTLSAALCHDWLSGMRGGERVLEMLCNGFPDAPIYTLLANPSAISQTITRHPIHTSWLQHLPAIEKHYRSLLPLFPAAIRTLNPPPETELLISTSHCVAKSIRTEPQTRHLCYCFTPMRYAWALCDEYLRAGSVKALLARPLLAGLRHWDRMTAERVDHFVAISHHIRRRIESFYGREADVVYPPVDTLRCTPGNTPGKQDFDLIVSALVPYKRIDLAVETYNRLGWPLKIVGVGGKRKELESKAAGHITFEGWRSDDEILDLYRECRLLVFPGEEDFGIVPLEAQACGKPVVAYAKGGALETVVDGKTGVFFERQTPEAMADAVNKAAARSWDPAILQQHAAQFGAENFVRGLAASIDKCMNQPSRRRVQQTAG